MLDLSWSPDASALVTGSIENLCLLWDVDARKASLSLENHTHYVQGVAFDPWGHYVVSQSNDKTCRVYGPRPAVQAAGRKGAAASSPASAYAACVAGIKEFVQQVAISKRADVAVGEAGQPSSNLKQRQTPALVGGNAATTDLQQAPPPPSPMPPPPPAEGGAASTPASAVIASQPPCAADAATPLSATVPTAASTAAVFRHGLFYDEALASFYRRLEWSPDGEEERSSLRRIDKISIPSHMIRHFLGSAGWHVQGRCYSTHPERHLYLWARGLVSLG